MGISRRVLHVVGGLHTGGAESWLAGVTPAVSAGGWETAFCLLDETEGPLAETFRQAGHTVERCSLRPIWTFPLRLKRLLSGGRYAVVHSHVLLFSGVIAAIAKAAGVPVRVVHAHNSYDGQGDGALRRASRGTMRATVRNFATHTLACSKDAEAFVGTSAEWLPYGVDLEDFRRPSTLLQRMEFGIPTEALVVGHVGRLTEQKNQAFLLRAFAEAAAMERRLHLAIAGEGRLRTQLEQVAQGLGIAERVHFLGRRDDVGALLMGLFDGFVMPSRHEGLPVALLEAQAAGLPCLVSDRIGSQVFVLPELIERLPIGAGTAEWAHAIRLLPGRGRLPRSKAAARMRLAGFDSRSSGARLLAFYERALRAAPGDMALADQEPAPFSS